MAIETIEDYVAELKSEPERQGVFRDSLIAFVNPIKRVLWASPDAVRSIYPNDYEGKKQFVDVVNTLPNTEFLTGALEDIVEGREELVTSSFNSLRSPSDDELIVTVTMRPFYNGTRVNYEVHKRHTVRDIKTGTYNPAHFKEEIVPDIVREAERDYNQTEHCLPYSIIVIDLGGFKEINDTYGHLEGDLMIEDAGKLLLDNVRPNNYVERFGGDEFLILSRDTDHNDAVEIIKRIESALANYNNSRIGGKPNLIMDMGFGTFTSIEDYRLLQKDYKQMDEHEKENHPISQADGMMYTRKGLRKQGVHENIETFLRNYNL